MPIRADQYDHRKPIFVEPGATEAVRWIDWKRGPLIQKPGYQAWRKPIPCPTESCGGYAGYLDTPLCEDCAWKTWTVLNANKDIERFSQYWDRIWQNYHDEKSAKEEVVTLIRETPEDTARRYNPGHVYYLLIGDLVKIGYTVDMDQRMKQYPPNSRLLAAHPGTMKTERQMHSKFFNHLAKGREWFAIHDELMAHIEDVRQRFTSYEVVEALPLAAA